MGFCEGGDLYTRLRMRNGVLLSERVLVEWFVQLAIALQYMHERNVLHRDLKTRNIFLTRSNIVKLGDLGIARVLESSNSMATTLIGTPYYMSPELFANKPYNHKSDIWALGCVLYEMSTLRHAFNAKSFNALSYKILSGKIPDMPTQYSPELLELMRAMLHLKPEKRPSARRVLSNSFIRKHIVLFLEATKDRATHSQNHSTIEDEVQNTSQHVECETGVPPITHQSANEIKMSNEKKTNEMKQQPIIINKEQNCEENSQLVSKQTLSIDRNDVYKQHERQIHPSNVNCIDELKDDSLHRHLSDARLRRRQRRQMSEVEGEQQHHLHHQQLKYEYQKEHVQTIKSSRSNNNNNHHSNHSNLKLHKISKFHFYSFSILPVSMLPKLYKNYKNNLITNIVTKHNPLNDNHYLEVIKDQNIEQLLTNQIHCNISSSPSSGIDQIKKNVLECKSNSTSQTKQTDPNPLDHILSSDQFKDISRKENWNDNIQVYSTEQDNRQNDINNQLVHQNDDKEIEAVVNCLADTLKDGCHPGAPAIIPRCKNGNKVPTVLANSNNCLSKDQRLLFKPNLEDNGPIEPKEETINRSVHLKQRFVELHRECIKNVGLKRLHEAYEILDQDVSSESQEILLKKILGIDIYSQYMSKIWQLKLLEQNAFEKESSS
uniref:non-specific serine/threonine protein kinase n=1 Tax=Schistosoma mansoni TaxID=6183 RepID=A0A5K4FE06_SCHMA